MVRYLVGVWARKLPGEGLRIGGPDQLPTSRCCAGGQVGKGSSPPIIQAPVLTPGLSSLWLALVTDVDVTTGRNLIDPMGIEVAS